MNGSQESPPRRRKGPLRNPFAVTALIKHLAAWMEVTPSQIKGHAVEAMIGVAVASIMTVTILVVTGAFTAMVDTIPFIGNNEDTFAAIAPVDSSSSLGGLQLVDTAFIESDSLPQIDIKLRNNGDEVAFVKRANFNIEKIWTLRWYSAGAGEPASGYYDLVLHKTGAPFVESLNISQSVDPNGVDRFIFTIDLDGGLSPFNDYIYLMSIDLVYDEDDKTISSEPLLYMIGYPGHFNTLDMFDSWLSIPDHIQGYLDRNSETLTEVYKVEGVRNERLQAIIDSLDDSEITSHPVDDPVDSG